MRIILGSESPSRRQVLDNAGWRYKTMAPKINEKAIRSDNLRELPILLARAKAVACLGEISGQSAVLITCDQVIECAGRLREKPSSLEEAAAFLRSYGQLSAQTNTAVVVTNAQTGQCAEQLDIATTHFNPLPEAVVERALLVEPVMKVAGAFLIESPLLSPYVRRIDGTRDSVLGLPLEVTSRLIEQVI